MKKLIEEFKRSRQDFIETLEKFPKEKRSEILFGTWNLKDVVAHFSAWDIFFIAILKPLMENKPVPYWGNINDFNKKEVMQRKTWNWEKVYKEFVKSSNNFIGEYGNLPPSFVNKPFWQGKTHTPEKILKINIHHYQKAQSIEIKKLLKKWGVK